MMDPAELENLIQSVSRTKDIVEELRAEAMMWEMNARKLMVDLDMLRTEFSEQSKNLADLRVELSDSCVERETLRREVQQLKQSLEDQMAKQKALEDSSSQGEFTPEVEKALKDELKFQKESYTNLCLELKRNQEANLELVSILHELEETIEQQKIEIDSLSALENKRLDVESAENTINKNLVDLEIQYESKLSAKEGEILNLKAKLSESVKERCNTEIVSRNGGDVDLMSEIEVLRGKVQELEMECNELADENLELLFELKKVKNNSRRGACVDLPPDISDAFQALHLEDMLEAGVIGEVKNDDQISIQELQSSKVALEIRIAELNNEVTDKTSQMADLEANLLSKEKEIRVLQNRQSELEAKVCEFQEEKNQLEEHMEVMLKERDINTKCLNDLQNDLGILSRSMDSHVSANEILRRKSLELENGKHELERHMSDLEKEKGQLAMQMSVLEAQLMYLTNERDSSLSELENSRSHAKMLQEEIMKIKSEVDSSIEDLKQNLKVTQCQLSESQQKCEYLRRANLQLQTTIENLAKECDSLQKLNGDLGKQKQELQVHCSILVDRLGESDQKFTDCSERVELLENKFAFVLEENASKEKSLISELDVLADENIRQDERGGSLMNQILMEKTAEIESLQQKIEHLCMELSATRNENERIASNATLEISALTADKAKLQYAFEEVQSDVISTKNEMNIMQTDYERKLQDLTTQFSAFKSDQEIWMADHEKLLKQVDDYKSRELTVNSTLKSLELKLNVTEYERQQLMEESENLKIQLHQIERFENENMALRNELNSTNSEKETLGASLCFISESCENLKAEKKSLVEKILTLENAVSELEDCRRSRVSLEEKLMRMESDLKEKETISAQEAEKKNELSHIKRINRHYQQTIRLLDKEKDEFKTKAEALEEEMKLIKEQKQNLKSEINGKTLRAHEALENSVVQNPGQHRGNRTKSFFRNDREKVQDERDISTGKHQSEVENEFGLLDGSAHAVEADSLSNIELHETELIKAEGANNMIEDQSNWGQSQGRNHKEAPMADGDIVTKERFERTKSVLEAELRDLQERYFHMSLKFAEVEAQREELVMKLKVAKNQKDVTL
ncbi:myosin heavy chain, fast skeletal muscle-like [Neltuma alba]|uniref:myosin heavy chain, fast skeletal muscle-like n=1 Tax=Neltuma alba TaxID=207710 RepID=UPI0010A41AD8|nr:myosin heavy chain, fast skeletal muscle-like [Prosopis alba]